MGVLEPLRKVFATHARGARARPQADGLLVQLRGRGLPRLRGRGLREGRAAVPARRVREVRGLRRPALPARGAGGALPRASRSPTRSTCPRPTWCACSATHAGVRGALQPMLDLGLGYLSLSQPAPTLSGGEAQRLKLARALAEAGERARAALPARRADDRPARRGRRRAGRARCTGSSRPATRSWSSSTTWSWRWPPTGSSTSGPEAGDEGGRLVGEGTPETVAAPRHADRARARRGARPRARARDGQRGRRAAERVRAREPAPSDRSASSARASTTCSGWTSTSRATSWSPSPASRARASRRSRSTCCSPRASGASSTASRPTCASSSGRWRGPRWTASRACRPPSRSSRSSRAARRCRRSAPRARSTTTCACSGRGSARCTARSAGCPGRWWTRPRSPRAWPRTSRGASSPLLAPLVRRRKGFHQDAIAAVAKKGVSEVRIDGALHAGRVAAARRPLPDPRRRGAGRRASASGRGAAGARAGDRAGARARRRHARWPWAGGGERFYSTRRACPSCGTGLPAPDPRLFSWSQKYGACPECDGFGAPRVEEDGELRRAEGVACPACAGTRLRPEARAVRIAGRHIGEVAALTRARGARLARDARGPAARRGARARLAGAGAAARPARPPRALGYLTLERGADTLSTGEAQRIRIVAALASNLRGVCYVLDEPTVGLHPRDDEALTQALLGLRDRGNTVVVVEHEESVIRAADHVIDLGPGAGPHGGRLVAQGTPRQVARVKESVTGRWLRGEGEQPPWPRRSLKDAARLAVDGRAAPQPARPDGRVPARPPHRRHRRLGLGQVDARARRALPRGEGAPRRPAAAAGAARAQGPARRRARARGGRVADRPHAALRAGDLRRHHGRDPDAVRRGARRARARLRPEPLLVQREGRPLRALRGPGTPARDDGAAARHVRPVRGVPRAAATTPTRWRCSFKGKTVAEVLAMTIDEARQLFSAVGAVRAAARLPVRDRPRLPAARPAVADALRRRGAAHQARRRADLAGLRPVALRARRADDRPAHGRRGPARDARCSASSTAATA